MLFDERNDDLDKHALKVLNFTILWLLSVDTGFNVQCCHRLIDAVNCHPLIIFAIPLEVMIQHFCDKWPPETRSIHTVEHLVDDVGRLGFFVRIWHGARIQMPFVQPRALLFRYSHNLQILSGRIHRYGNVIKRPKIPWLNLLSQVQTGEICCSDTDRISPVHDSQ